MKAKTAKRKTSADASAALLEAAAAQDASAREAMKAAVLHLAAAQRLELVARALTPGRRSIQA